MDNLPLMELINHLLVFLWTTGRSLSRDLVRDTEKGNSQYASHSSQEEKRWQRGQVYSPLFIYARAS